MVKYLKAKTLHQLPKGNWTETTVCVDFKGFSPKAEWMKASSSADNLAYKKAGSEQPIYTGFLIS